MPSIGAPEIVIILVLALLVFGPKRLPEMGRSLGRTVREFKKASDSARKEFGVDEIEREMKGVKKTLADVKGDLKVDIDAETAKPGADKAAAEAAAATAAAAAVATGAAVADGAGPATGEAVGSSGDAADDEVLVGDVVDEERPDQDVLAALEDDATTPVEDAVVDEAADGPVDVGRMTEGSVGPEATDKEIADPQTVGADGGGAPAGTATPGV
jgi:sec-independent protein translocase protein TatA